MFSLDYASFGVYTGMQYPFDYDFCNCTLNKHSDVINVWRSRRMKKGDDIGVPSPFRHELPIETIMYLRQRESTLSKSRKLNCSTLLLNSNDIAVPIQLNLSDAKPLLVYRILLLTLDRRRQSDGSISYAYHTLVSAIWIHVPFFIILFLIEN